MQSRLQNLLYVTMTYHSFDCFETRFKILKISQINTINSYHDRFKLHGKIIKKIIKSYVHEICTASNIHGIRVLEEHNNFSNTFCNDPLLRTRNDIYEKEIKPK